MHINGIAVARMQSGRKTCYSCAFHRTEIPFTSSFLREYMHFSFYDAPSESLTARESKEWRETAPEPIPQWLSPVRRSAFGVRI